jgi:CRP-like cAMP-binding protein
LYLQVQSSGIFGRLLDPGNGGRYDPAMKSLAAESVARILRQGAWFSRQSPQVQRSLVSAGTIVHYDEGAWIFGEADMATGLFALLDGFIKGYVGLTQQEQILFDYAGPGIWFGQVSLLKAPRRIATLLAATDATLLHIPRPALLKLARAQPAIWEALAELSHLQMQGMMTALAQRSLPPVARVAARLSSLVPVSVRRSSGAAELRISQSELAEMIGLERKTVHRALKQLSQRGLVTTTYRTIRVVDRRSLKRIGDIAPD